MQLRIFLAKIASGGQNGVAKNQVGGSLRIISPRTAVRSSENLVLNSYRSRLFARVPVSISAHSAASCQSSSRLPPAVRRIFSPRLCPWRSESLPLSLAGTSHRLKAPMLDREKNSTAIRPRDDRLEAARGSFGCPHVSLSSRSLALCPSWASVIL
jgi:hypothetical protein